MKNQQLLKQLPLLLLMSIPFAYIAYRWSDIPAVVPIHFDMAGHPNGWGSRVNLFILPIVSVLTYLLVQFLPMIDPKRMQNYTNSSMFFRLRLAIVFFVTLLSLLITRIAIADSVTPAITRWIPTVIFLLLAIFGNLMINLKPNWFIGIRTPWTMSSDTVWRQTHRVVGRVWFYGGLICVALSLLIHGTWASKLMLTFLLATVVFAFVYSYWLYRKELDASHQ